MDDEVKLWFDLVSRYKDQVNKNRQFNTTIIIAIVGGLVWLINVGVWSSAWLSSFEVLVRLVAIVVLLSIFVILLGANLSQGRIDKVFNDILMRILSGDLANRDQIREEYIRKTEEVTGEIMRDYNMAASTLPRSK